MGCPCSCQAGWRVVLGKDAMQIRSFLLAAAGGLMLAACSQPEELPPAAAAPPPPPPGAVAGSVAADRDGDGIIDGYYTADGISHPNVAPPPPPPPPHPATTGERDCQREHGACGTPDSPLSHRNH